MNDWKREALRLRTIEKWPWADIIPVFRSTFPELNDEQIRKKLGDGVRDAQGTRYRWREKKRQERIAEQPTDEPYSTKNGWKNGVFESDDLIQMCAEDAKSPRRMLELHGLDPDEWEVVSCTNNLWHGQRHHSQVEKHGPRVMLYQSKLTAKPITDAVTLADIRKMFENAEFWRSRPSVTPMQYDPGGEVLEIDIADLHSGLYAWARETGADYDVRIAREHFMRVISDNIERCKGRRFRKIIIALLGDLLHIDTENQTTTKGTFQQADGRISKIFRETLYMLADAIDLFKAIAPVEVIYTRGNHDGMSGPMLAMALEFGYRGKEGVVIDAEPDPQKWRLIGDSLIGFFHGDVPKKNAAGWIQVIARKIGSPVRFIEVHKGHDHAQNVREFIQTEDNEGVVIRTIPTITNSSTWEHYEGYSGATRSSMSFVWNEHSGLREMWYCNM